MFWLLFDPAVKGLARRHLSRDLLATRQRNHLHHKDVPKHHAIARKSAGPADIQDRYNWNCHRGGSGWSAWKSK